MKAAVYQTYGPPEVLKIMDIDPPVFGEEHTDRVLIEVHHASVNPFDYLHRSGYFPVRMTNGFFTPKEQVLGIDVAGRIIRIGSGVTRFQVGDLVYGNCLGSHAETVRARENTISIMPKNLTTQQAAAVPTAGLTALQALRDVAQITPGQKILINGASGGIGHFAVQISRFYEGEVTAVCSTTNLTWVKELGADHLIDYTREDFTKNGAQYDVIFDTVAKRTYFKCKHSLTPTGVYITENPLRPAGQAFQVLFSAVIRDYQVKTHLTQPGYEDLDFLRQLIETEKLKPVIEKIYPLNAIVAAHRHVQNGHTQGKIVIEVQTE
jgi:NADPH:quinone reductase-like Zn-dependent oxidoreductase